MPKPREPAAQFAQGEAQDQRQAPEDGGGRGAAGETEPCMRSASGARPRRRPRCGRSAGARCGRSGRRGRRSWVTRTRVAPRSRFRAKRRSTIDRPGRLVEVAGRLVGDQDRRDRRRWRGRWRRAAARRPRAAPDNGDRRSPRPTAAQLGLGALEGVGGAGELERQGDVLERRHGRHEVEGLEDDADAPAAKAGERVLVEAREIGAVDDDAAANRAARGRPWSSAGSTCPSPRARRGRSPRPGRPRGRCP